MQAGTKAAYYKMRVRAFKIAAVSLPLLWALLLWRYYDPGLEYGYTFWELGIVALLLAICIYSIAPFLKMMIPVFEAENAEDRVAAFRKERMPLKIMGAFIIYILVLELVLNFMLPLDISIIMMAVGGAVISILGGGLCVLATWLIIRYDTPPFQKWNRE